ncbi:tyrosine-type recombinase/integrase [Vibrio parahaemolyticus]|nr:integrase [Vibrio parahaemolyticus]EIE1222549.1 tyrosine-type recombinase/integrase [Vibrio parahaemolyticus]EIE1260586.1 tyrosine-type recombinase/integrase [Vibrio parahaemolyticus]EIE1338196.1 tyrosine-type recombinase/integrase [Vibrio parahaemolyticus]EJC6883522.1 tyrosine-type recombinase/integrase [Vibrio parahaemolyticus]
MGLRGNSLRVACHNIRSFLTWVESEPLRSKRDFDAFLAQEYVKHVDGLMTKRKGELQPLKPTSKAQRYLALEELYRHGRMFDWVKEPPWINSSACEQAGTIGEADPRKKGEGKTLIIPDEVLKPLATYTKDYLDRATKLLNLRDKLDAFEPTAKRASDQAAQKRRYLQSISDEFDKLDDFNDALLLLRDSCIFWLLFTTGMRIHEVLNIKRSLRGRGNKNYRTETKDEETFYYIQSASDKTHTGKAEWIAPQIAIEAIKVLERYSKPYQARLAADLKAAKNQGNHKEVARLSEINNHLILAKDKTKKGCPICIPSNENITAHRLKNLCKITELDWDLAAHQLRRTFANYVVHSELGDLRALKEHFKHWSISMTVLYAANDDLDQELFEELLREKLFIEEETFSDFFALDYPITGGAVADNIKEFRSNEEVIKVYGNHKAMARATKTSLRFTGIGWCTNDDDGCMGGDCDECEHGIIDKRNIKHWEGMLIQQLELVNLDDIGDSGREAVQKGLVRTEKVLTSLGYDVAAMKNELSNNNQSQQAS